MATIRFENSLGFTLDMSDTNFTKLATVNRTEDVFWNYETVSGDRLELTGDGLTFNDDGLPVTGTFEEVEFDITGASTLVKVGNLALDANQAGRNTTRLWDLMLAGDDLFDVKFLGAESAGISLLYGDALTARRGKKASQVTGEGGDDTFETGEASYALVGDVLTVIGAGKGKAQFARFEGGNDTFEGTITDEKHELVGDAGTVGFNATLVGGDDGMSIAATAQGSIAIGDVTTAEGARSRFARIVGGDDDISVLQGGGESVLVGDVHIVRSFVRVEGGDDEMTGGNEGDDLFGDVRFDFSARGSSIKGGDDTIDGGDGDDFLVGDRFDSSGRSSLKGGNDILIGGNGNDRLLGETLQSDDTDLEGRVSGGNDSLNGGAGDDLLFGQTGKDTLNGGSDDDRLDGGEGNDRLLGGLGADRLTGGNGADSFVFKLIDESKDNEVGRDIIADFSRREGDRIEMPDFTLSPGVPGKYAFIGDAEFSGEIGQLRFEIDGGDTLVQADIDGDGGSDFAFVLDQEIALRLDDFLF